MTPNDLKQLWFHDSDITETGKSQSLWETYFRRMVGLARKKLDGKSFPLGGAEDAAMSALKSFCRGVEEGKFRDLTSENNLWALLATITVRKAYRLRQKSYAKDAEPFPDEFQVGISDPSPEEQALFSDTVARLFSSLDDPELCEVARLRIDGLSLQEIASQIGKTERRVKYKLKLVRQIWEPELNT